MSCPESDRSHPVIPGLSDGSSLSVLSVDSNNWVWGVIYPPLFSYDGSLVRLPTIAVTLSADCLFGLNRDGRDTDTVVGSVVWSATACPVLGSIH